MEDLVKNLKDEVLAEVRSIKESTSKEIEGLKAEKRSLEQKVVEIGTRSLEGASHFRSLIAPMGEKRAITVNGTDAINQVGEIIQNAKQKTPLLGGASYFYGPNGKTVISILAPLSSPVTASEGYTSGSDDSGAGLSELEIVPAAYVKTLKVSWEALNLSYANLEKELPGIFADEYAQVMYKLMVDAMFASGGVATGNKIECGAIGLPKIMDLVGATLQARDYSDNLIAVIAPSVYSSLLGDTTSGVAQLYKEELIRNKTIEGVKVIVTGRAPVDTTTGNTLCVIGDMKNFAFGVGSQLMITPKTKVADGNTYFDSVMYFGGKVINPNNFWALKAK